jgi:negative regulator of flagellin synthesis FlgM
MGKAHSGHFGDLMKIGNPADKPSAIGPTASHGAVESTKAGTSAAPAAACVATAPDPSATVELSSAAATLLSGGTPAEFDAEKVARIAQAIADGSFKINPDVIADKLIGNARELLAKVQR